MRLARTLAGLFVTVCLSLNGTDVYAGSSEITVSSDQIVLVPAPVIRVCDVIEQISLTNPSGQPQTLSFSIPAASTHVTVNGIKVPSGMGGKSIIRLPVPKAGTSSATVAFQIPFTSAAGVDIPFRFPSAVDLVKLYLPITGFSLSAPGLKAATQTVTMSGSRFRVYSRLGITSGETFPVSIEGLPSLTSAFQLQGVRSLGQDPSGLANELGALGNIGVIVLVLLLCFVGMGTESRKQSVDGRGRSQSPSTSIDSLYTAWTDIELKYRDDVLDEDTYTKQRQLIRDRIVRLERDKATSMHSGGSSA